MIPQLILTLSPSGDLLLERPMAGTRQQIPIAPGTLESTARRILSAQLRSETHLGEDGLPTTAQVHHWASHSDYTEPTCPFCQSESAALSPSKTRRARAPRTSRKISVGNGTVTVKYMPPSSSSLKSFGGPSLTSPLSADDLGL